MKIEFFNGKLLGFLFLFCAITPVLGTERRLNNTMSDLRGVKYDLDELFSDWDSKYSGAFRMLGLNIDSIMHASQKLGGATVDAVSEVCSELRQVCGELRELKKDINRVEKSTAQF